MYSRRKMLKNIMPGSFLVGSSPVTLIYYYKIKKIRWILLVVSSNIFFFADSLINSKKYISIGWNFASSFFDFASVDFDYFFFQRIESIHSLIYQNISVSKEKNLWSVGVGFIVPSCLKKLPNNLKSYKCFSGTCGKS